MTKIVAIWLEYEESEDKPHYLKRMLWQPTSKMLLEYEELEIPEEQIFEITDSLESKPKPKIVVSTIDGAKELRTYIQEWFGKENVDSVNLNLIRKKLPVLRKEPNGKIIFLISEVDAVLKNWEMV